MYVCRQKLNDEVNGVGRLAILPSEIRIVHFKDYHLEALWLQQMASKLTKILWLFLTMCQKYDLKMRGKSIRALFQINDPYILLKKIINIRVLIRLQQYSCCIILVTVGWGTKAQCFCPLYWNTWFFYVVLMLN